MNKEQLLALLERLRAPSGKFNLIEVDTFEQLDSADSLIAVFDTAKEAVAQAKVLSAQNKNLKYYVYNDAAELIDDSNKLDEESLNKASLDKARSFYDERDTSNLNLDSEYPYDWIDLQLGGINISGNQPQGAKTVGKNIERGLFNSFKEEIDSYVESLSNETQIEIQTNIEDIIESWNITNQKEIDEAFDRLFKLGLAAGVTSTGHQFHANDQLALDILRTGKYRIGERIKLFGEEAIQEFQSIIEQAYTPTGVFDLDYLTSEMKQAVSDQRYKLERIVRTETGQVSNLGRLWGWANDEDKYFYDYHWNSTPDTRRRVMKELRSSGNPYTYDEIKFLWLYNEQNVPNVGWQNGTINCRCTISRYPRETEFKGDRFADQQANFHRTLAIDF